VDGADRWNSSDGGWSPHVEVGSDVAQEGEDSAATLAGEGGGFGQFGHGLPEFT